MMQFAIPDTQQQALEFIAAKAEMNVEDYVSQMLDKLIEEELENLEEERIGIQMASRLTDNAGWVSKEQIFGKR